MPIEIEAMPKSSNGRQPTYDLTPVFDGRSYLLLHGTKDEVESGNADFHSKPESFRATIYRAAQIADKRVVVKATSHEGRDALAVQAVGPYVPRKRKAADDNGEQPEVEDAVEDQVEDDEDYS